MGNPPSIAESTGRHMARSRQPEYVTPPDPDGVAKKTVPNPIQQHWQSQAQLTSAVVANTVIKSGTIMFSGVSRAHINTRLARAEPEGRTPALLCHPGLRQSLHKHARSLRTKPNTYSESLQISHPGQIRLDALQVPVDRPILSSDNGAGVRNNQPKGKRRRLIMMRHAESEERPADARDHDRPITEFGKRTAQQIAEKLKQKGWLPDLIMCSNSKRTKQTLEAMSAVVSAFSTARTQFRGSLYSASALDGQTRSHLQELISEAASDAVQTIMALGHNKGWEEAASALSGTKVRLETSNAALLEVTSRSWDEAMSEEGRWHLVDLLLPDTPPA